jgi:hypothetical protein
MWKRGGAGGSVPPAFASGCGIFPQPAMDFPNSWIAGPEILRNASQKCSSDLFSRNSLSLKANGRGEPTNFIIIKKH